MDGMVPGLNTVGTALTNQMTLVEAEMARLQAQLLLLNQRVQDFVAQGLASAATEMQRLVPAITAATTQFTDFTGALGNPGTGATPKVQEFGDETETASGKLRTFSSELDNAITILRGLGSGGAPTSDLRGGGGGRTSAIGTALSTIRRTPQLMRGYTG